MTPQEMAKALGRGKEVRKSDTTWNTVCPAHADNGPSLSISEKNGKLLFKCHAGCSQGAILECLEAAGLWESKARGGIWNPLPYAPDGKSLPMDLKHPKFGKPSIIYKYIDSENRFVGAVCRFNLREGKEIVPVCWCKSDDGKEDWAWKSFKKPRPLYNENLLQGNTKPVLIVEGEKAADAAAKLVTDHVVVSWPGGSNAVKFAKFEILAKRKVVIWPDADEPGHKAAASIANILYAAGNTEVYLVDLPVGLPKGWDLADAIPGDVTMDVPNHLRNATQFKPKSDNLIDDMNKQYALTILGDKAVIIWERWDPNTKRFIPNYVNAAALRMQLANKFVTVGRKELPVFDYWLEHEDRKTYDGVVFEPGITTPGYYNLWRGFTYDPDPTGDWSMLQEHLMQNVAQGDESLYNWIVGWFAQMIQQPRMKPGTSLSLRGRQGTGKTIIGQHFGALMRDNYVYVDDERYVTGQFNSHMANALLMQADESFFAGDPRHIGRLKGMVTANTNRIEPKGKDSFEINNYLRLLITSNEAWIVPAAFEERRFAVVDVSEGRMQDRNYFKAMADQMRSGGYEGLLHYLQTFDLTTIDIGRIPSTKALSDQKHHTLNGVSRFWFERIRDGEITQTRSDWPDAVQCEEFYLAFIKRMMQWGALRKPSDSQFGKELKEFMPHGALNRVKKLTDIYDERGSMTRARRWCYEIPPLEECRAKFDEVMGSATDWEKNSHEAETKAGPRSVAVDDTPF
jgi:hypothetical protein